MGDFCLYIALKINQASRKIWVIKKHDAIYETLVKKEYVISTTTHQVGHCKTVH